MDFTFSFYGIATLEMQAVIGRYSMKKMFLEVSTGKHLHRNLFFSKVAGINPATLFKKTLRHRCFPVNFENFVRTLFIEHHRVTDPETQFMSFKVAVLKNIAKLTGEKVHMKLQV